MNDDAYRTLHDFYESEELVKQMNEYMLKNNIFIVFVSERLFDVLNTYYYIQGKYEYILDPNRIYLDYGFSKLKTKINNINIFLYDTYIL